MPKEMEGKMTKDDLIKIREEYKLEFLKAEKDFRIEMKSGKNRLGKNGASHYTGNGYGVLGARLASTRNCLISIDEAISRIEKGTYGICEKCGEEIPLKRLQIVPYTRFCIKCLSK